MPAGVTNTVEVIANSALASRVRAVKEPGAVIKDTLIEMDIELVGVETIPFTLALSSLIIGRE